MADFREVRKHYRERKNQYGYGGKEPHSDNLYQLGEAYLHTDDPEHISEARVRIASTAHELMESHIPKEFILGAQLYEKIGKGRKAIPKLLNRRKVYVTHEADMTKQDDDTIRDFIKRNAGRQQQEGGLAGKLPVFILFTVAGVALSVTSLGSTGHAISDVTGTTQGLAGVFLFILGLTGIAFGLKK